MKDKTCLILFLLVVLNSLSLFAEDWTLDIENKYISIGNDSFYIKDIFSDKINKDSLGIIRVGLGKQRTKVKTNNDIDQIIQNMLMQNLYQKPMHQIAVLIDKFSVNEFSDGYSKCEIRFIFYLINDQKNKTIQRIYEYNKSKVFRNVIYDTSSHNTNMYDLLKSCFQDFTKFNFFSIKPIYNTKDEILVHYPKIDVCEVCYPELEKAGLEYYSPLNENESMILNRITSDEYNFHTGQKIAFMKSVFIPNGKVQFFQNLSYPIDKKKRIIIKPTADEMKVIDYDYIIIDQTNDLYPKDRELVIENLKKRDKFVPEYIDNMGLDDRVILNESEKDYLNNVYSDKGIDFTDKKICYLKISNEMQFLTKKDYFKRIKDKIIQSGNFVSDYIIIFNDVQKQKNGGIDAAILTVYENIPEINDEFLSEIKANFSKTIGK